MSPEVEAAARDLVAFYTEAGLFRLAWAYLDELEALDHPEAPSAAQGALRAALKGRRRPKKAETAYPLNLTSGPPPEAVLEALRIAREGKGLPKAPRDRMKESIAAAQKKAATLVELRSQRQTETLKDLIFVSRYLVAMSLPYAPTKERQVTKSARLGDGRRIHLQLSAVVPGVDLPFGSDRTLLHWLLDQIARQVGAAIREGAAGDVLEQSRFVRWDSAADYLRDMGLNTDSGKNYKDLRARYRRLSGLSIGLLIEGPNRDTIHNIPLIERAELPSSIDLQAESAGQSRLVDLQFGVLFSRRLVEALMESAVPFPKEILRKTRKQSQMQDYWLFLAWRSYAASAPSTIPWEEVQEQLWQQDQTLRRIKTRFAEAIVALKLIWPELQAEARPKGLWVAPPIGGAQLIGRGGDIKRLRG